MNIYFAGSIRGAQRPDQQSINAHILDCVRQEGHQIISEHSLVTDKHHMEMWTDHQIYEQDCKWVRNSWALIAECSCPSHGVGYEICLAEANFIPVLVLHHADTTVSAMLSGNANIEVRSYADLDSLTPIIHDFLTRAEQD